MLIGYKYSHTESEYEAVMFFRLRLIFLNFSTVKRRINRSQMSQNGNNNLLALLR